MARVEKGKICCFGHREIVGLDEISRLEKQIKKFLLEQIFDNEMEIFMTGGRGEFDDLFSSVIRVLKRECVNIKLLLIEPYFSNRLNNQKAYYETMYDSVIIPNEISEAHPKNAIYLRNRWMIENSDLVIAYVNRKGGGAYKAIEYANKINKQVINFGLI